MKTVSPCLGNEREGFCCFPPVKYKERKLTLCSDDCQGACGGKMGDRSRPLGSCVENT